MTNLVSNAPNSNFLELPLFEWASRQQNRRPSRLNYAARTLCRRYHVQPAHAAIVAELVGFKSEVR